MKYSERLSVATALRAAAEALMAAEQNPDAYRKEHGRCPPGYTFDHSDEKCEETKDSPSPPKKKATKPKPEAKPKSGPAPKSTVPLAAPVEVQEAGDDADEDGNQLYKTSALEDAVISDFDRFQKAVGKDLSIKPAGDGTFKGTDEDEMRSQVRALQIFSKMKDVAALLGEHPSMEEPEVRLNRRGAFFVFGKSDDPKKGPGAGGDWDDSVPQLHLSWDRDNPDSVHIDLIVISPDKRGKGAGLKALSEMRDKLKSIGISKVTLNPGNPKFWSKYTGKKITDKFSTIEIEANVE